MAALLTITANERGDVRLAAQVLFYPVTNAAFGTGSYEEFAAGYFLRRDGMQWFWDQYTTDPAERALPTASPLQASAKQLTGLPPALVITGEADVLPDEGEVYANHLRAAGVSVTATAIRASSRLRDAQPPPRNQRCRGRHHAGDRLPRQKAWDPWLTFGWSAAFSPPTDGGGGAPTVLLLRRATLYLAARCLHVKGLDGCVPMRRGRALTPVRTWL
jgi:acetyl esterase/lipase